MGDDIADFSTTCLLARMRRRRSAGRRGDDAFVLQADGKAWLFAPNVDGPPPTHYEPDESPVRNRLHGLKRQPDAQAPQPFGQPGEPGGGHRGVPLRAHRVQAHRAPHRGRMSRWLPFLAELQPELFVEVSPSWRLRGLEHNGWCHVITSRTAVQAKVAVTQRIRPLRVQGQTVHQVWMPLPLRARRAGHRRRDERPARHVADPNVHIQEGRRWPPATRPGLRPTGCRWPTSRTTKPAGRSAQWVRAPRATACSARSTTSATPATSTTRHAHGVLHRPRLFASRMARRWPAQWNGVPAGDELDLLGMSHDNTGEPGANPGGTWPSLSRLRRHLSTPADLGMPGMQPLGAATGVETRHRLPLADVVDVCKHCTHAGCPDVCPTGALFRTGSSASVVQQDICRLRKHRSRAACTA